MKVSGNIVDIENKLIFKGEITVVNGIITEIVQKDNANDSFILPGFIDLHVHGAGVRISTLKVRC